MVRVSTLKHPASTLVLLMSGLCLIGLASTAAYASPLPGGVYIGTVYMNGHPMAEGSYTVNVSSGPRYFSTEYYVDGSYEMDITLPDSSQTTGDIVVTVPGVGLQTLPNVSLEQNNKSASFYFTSGSYVAPSIASSTASALASDTAAPLEPLLALLAIAIGIIGASFLITNKK